MVVNTISKTVRWLSRDNLLKIIKCGMVNALKKALETPAGRGLLLVEDSKGNVASHRAAYHPNPELFLEILKTEEGRKTLSFGNHDSELVVDVLIEYGRVDLINEVLKTKEGKAAILVETEYEANNYAGIRTLLKCNISLDQIFKYQDNKGMVQDAVDEDDFEAFQVFMERAELRNKVFALSSDGIKKLHEKGLLKPLLEKHWLEILQSTGRNDLLDFIKTAVECGLLNEIMDRLDKEHPNLLSAILNSIVSYDTPISDGLDEALSLVVSKTNVRKWVFETKPQDPDKMHFKRFVAKGAAKTVEAILNDNFLRRNCDLQDMFGNTFLHCAEVPYERDDESISYENSLLEDEGSIERFYNCLRKIADNQHLKAALPRILLIKNGEGNTPLNLALKEMPELFQILLDWSVRPENIASLHVLDNKGCTPFYNAILNGCDISTITKFINADASFVSSIFDHLDNEMVNVISRVLDDKVEGGAAKIAFRNVFELVKDKPILMRKFIDSVGNESGCSSLEYARKYDMPIVVDAILTFAQDTSLGLSLPSASLETQASSSIAWVPSVDDGAEATVNIPAYVTSKANIKRARDDDDDNDYDDKTEEHKRCRKNESPARD